LKVWANADQLQLLGKQARLVVQRGRS
jgi:hypothetical protein